MYTQDVVFSIKDQMPPVGGRGFVNHPYFDYEKPFAGTAINNAGIPQIDHMPAPSYGMTYSDLLTKPDLTKKFLIDVIQMNYSVGHLSVPPLVRSIWWEHRKGTMVLTPLFEVHSNVGEGEVVPLRTVNSDKLEVSMTKSVMKIGITDEMKMDAGDAFITPQDYMRSRLGEAFAYELDNQIMEQLKRDPMKLTVNIPDPDSTKTQDTRSQAIHKLIEKGIPQIIGAFMRSNIRVTGVAVHPSTWAFFQGILNHDYHGLAMYREGVFPLLQGVDICPCNIVPYDKMYFVSNEAPGIMVLNYPDVIGRAFDDIDTGSEIQRVDVYRQCFSNIMRRKIMKGGSEYHANAGVLELTLNGAPNPDVLEDI